VKYLYTGIIAPASVIIPIGAGLIKKTYRQNCLRVIFFYLIFSGLSDVAERIVGSYHINNLPLLHVYTVLEFLFIIYFLQVALKNRAISKLIWALMIVFPVFCVLDLVFLQSIYQFNSYPRPVAALIIIGFCIYYFFSRGGADNPKPWINEPLNWIMTGLLVYFGSSLLHFAFLNVLYEHASLQVNYIFGTIHATLVMLMYLLFTAGFVYAKNE
jgi:hypothetical protein